MPALSRRALLTAAAIPLLAPAVLAQPFPARPIQLIVPFAPGGGTEIVARHYVAAAGRLGVPMQVVPVPGAGGARGTRQVAQATPDGLTLLFGTMGSNVTTPMLNEVGFQPDSFDPVAVVGAPSFIFAVGTASEVRSLPDLVRAAQRGQLSYGSAGAGSSTHVAMEIFARRTGVEFLHVPFNGSAEALTAVLGGHVDMALPTTGSGLPPIRSGHVRGIAITAEARSAAAPEIPTVREQGVDFVFYNWRGVLAPKGTPATVLAFLTDLSRRIVADPEFVAQSTRAEGEPPIFRDAAAFAAQIGREVEEQREVTASMRRR